LFSRFQRIKYMQEIVAEQKGRQCDRDYHWVSVK